MFTSTYTKPVNEQCGMTMIVISGIPKAFNRARMRLIWLTL